MDPTAYPCLIRIRERDREVELRGSERFVLEQLPKLVEEHLGPANPAGVADSMWTAGGVNLGASGTASGQTSGETVPVTFRDLLNAAGSATAAERLLLAGFRVQLSGRDTFDAAAAAAEYDAAYEPKPNFSRELTNAARAGWITKVGEDGKRAVFRLTYRGIQRAREMSAMQEVV